MKFNSYSADVCINGVKRRFRKMCDTNICPARHSLANGEWRIHNQCMNYCVSEFFYSSEPITAEGVGKLL